MGNARWIVGFLLNVISTWGLLKFAYEFSMVFWGHGETDAGRLVRNPKSRMWYFLLLVAIGIAGYVIVADWIYCVVATAMTIYFYRRGKLIALNEVVDRTMRGLLAAGMTEEDAKVVAADILKSVIAARKMGGIN